MDITPDLLVFTDIEASSLSLLSYPVEIGWTGVDLQPHHFLIKPHETWGRDDWSPIAEQIHGISWERLQDEGIDVKDAADRVRSAFHRKLIISDNPSYEARWFYRLFEAVGEPVDFVVMAPVDRLLTRIVHLEQVWTEAVKMEGTGHWTSIQAVLARVEEVMRAFPHTHRASDDAIKMAASVKSLLEPEWDYKAARKEFLPVGEVASRMK